MSPRFVQASVKPGWAVAAVHSRDLTAAQDAAVHPPSSSSRAAVPDCWISATVTGSAPRVSRGTTSPHDPSMPFAATATPFGVGV